MRRLAVGFALGAAVALRYGDLAVCVGVALHDKASEVAGRRVPSTWARFERTWQDIDALPEVQP